MAAPYISDDGDVYTDTHVMFADPKWCTHRHIHVCVNCDRDLAWATSFPDVCPWAESAA